MLHTSKQHRTSYLVLLLLLGCRRGRCSRCCRRRRRPRRQILRFVRGVDDVHGGVVHLSSGRRVRRRRGRLQVVVCVVRGGG